MVDSVTKNIAKFYPYLEKQFNIDTDDEDSNCWISYYDNLDSIKQTIQVHSLNENQALISHQCWVVAYNNADLYWLVDKNLDDVEQIGEATSFEGGILGFSMKWRGVGDCWSIDHIVWDGSKFQTSGKRNTGMCKGAAGGFWDIPTYVTEVIQYQDKLL